LPFARDALRSELETPINQRLASGRYESVEDVLRRALEGAGRGGKLDQRGALHAVKFRR